MGKKKITFNLWKANSDHGDSYYFIGKMVKGRCSLCDNKKMVDESICDINYKGKFVKKNHALVCPECMAFVEHKLLATFKAENFSNKIKAKILTLVNL
jgi:uncharacterized protein YlaI